MDFRRQALLILVALTSALGCRHDQAVKRELLERDLRMQEDRIYELEAQLEDTQRALDRARGVVREELPSGSRPGLGGLFGGSAGGVNEQRTIDSDPRNATGAPSGINPGSSSGSGTPSVILPPKGDTGPPAVELPGGTGAAPPFKGAPIISPPDPKKPEGVPAPGGSAPPFKPGGARSGGSDVDGFARGTPRLKEMSSPKFVSPGALGNTSSDQSSSDQSEVGDVLPVPLPADQTVKTISLNRRTGGWNSDGKPGDDGITVVVEPRNARGEVVAVPGSVVIALWDPAIEGEAGLYSKWDFAVTDAGAMFRSLAAGGSGGMHFELKWPEGPPAHSKLALFVRYVTADGRRLQAEKELHIDLGSGTTSAWRNPAAQPTFTASRNFGPTTAGATREVGTTNTAVRAGGEANVNAAAPLHWSRPKTSSAATQTPEVLSPPTNAQPLGDSAIGPQTGPALGPALIAPRN